MLHPRNSPAPRRKLDHLILTGVGAECFYLAGRTAIVLVFEDAVVKEWALTIWRIPFIFIYARLFDLSPGAEGREKFPSHPLLWLSIALACTAGPAAWHEYSFDSLTLLFMATTPVVALREELFYRCLLVGSLGRIWNPAGAIGLSTLAYTVMHVGTQPMNTLTISALAALGTLLAVLYQRTGSLLLVVAVHIAFNWLTEIPHRFFFDPSLIVAGNVAALVGGITWWLRTRSSNDPIRKR